jgi:hypothetical protein
LKGRKSVPAEVLFKLRPEEKEIVQTSCRVKKREGNSVCKDSEGKRPATLAETKKFHGTRIGWK